MDIKTTAGIMGPPKQAIQYAHAYLRNIAGSVLKKKTRKTLNAMANDHQGSDCINLQELAKKMTEPYRIQYTPFEDKGLSLAESRLVSAKQSIVTHHGRYTCPRVC